MPHTLKAIVGIGCLALAALLFVHLLRGQMPPNACVTLTSGRDTICQIEVWGEPLTIKAGFNTVMLANPPQPGTVRIYRNGLRMALVSDYEIVNQMVTFTVPLQPDDTLLADYRF